MKLAKTSLIVLFISALLFSPVLSQESQPNLLKARVMKVVDGDTIDIRLSDGEQDTVRYIGVDAPEVNRCYAGEATNHNEVLVTNRIVWLEKGFPSSRDRYGRLLAWVYLDEKGTKSNMVNSLLVKGGSAWIAYYPETKEYIDLLWENQQQAVETGQGLWCRCLQLCGPTCEDKETVLINEIEQNPQGTDSGNEWVELFNPNDKDINIGGWLLSTWHGRVVHVKLPKDTIIPSHGFWVYSHYRQWLDNNDEAVILYDDSGREIDVAGMFDDTKNNSKCWARHPNGKDTNSRDDWEFQACTKGRSKES